MRYTTKTEYALICLANLAKMGPQAKVAIKELTEKENYPYSYVEKIFQNLRMSGIVHSYQGNQGGYMLARPASEISLREIIEAIEGSTFAIFCSCSEEKSEAREVICNHQVTCTLRSVWQSAKTMLDQFFSSINLEMLANEELDLAKILPKLPSVASAEIRGNV